MTEKIRSSNAKYNDKVAALLHELSGYSVEKLNQVPANGGWSPIQTAWHLLLVEELSFQYVQKKIHYGGTFEKPGLLARARAFLLKLFLMLPFKFKAPGRSTKDDLSTEIRFSELEERWKAVRKNWSSFFETMPEALQDKSVYKHPRAGRLSWDQMLEFFSDHFDRHLAQVRRGLNG